MILKLSPILFFLVWKLQNDKTTDFVYAFIYSTFTMTNQNCFNVFFKIAKCFEFLSYKVSVYHSKISDERRINEFVTARMKLIIAESTNHSFTIHLSFMILKERSIRFVLFVSFKIICVENVFLLDIFIINTNCWWFTFKKKNAQNSQSKLVALQILRCYRIVVVVVT